MSGVHGFVKRDDSQHPTPPPSTQPLQQPRHGKPDRTAIAAGARIKGNRGGRPAVPLQTFGQTLSSTAPAPGYDSNPIGFRNTFPNMAFNQQENIAPVQAVVQDLGFVAEDEQHVQRRVFDDTITSSFDDTKSDLQYNGYGMDNGGGSVNDQSYQLLVDGGRQQHAQPDSRQHVVHLEQPSKHFNSTQHVLQHQQIAYAEQAPLGIVGRFETPAIDQWQQNIAHRNSNGQQVNTSSPQRQLNDPAYSDDRDEEAQQKSMGHREGDSYDDSESSVDPDLAIEQVGVVNDRIQHGVGNDGFKLRTDGVESGFTRSLSARVEIERVLQARQDDPKRSTLDHDDEILETMAFADLKKESWDIKPSARSGGQKRLKQSQPQDSEFSFEEVIDYFVKNETAEAQVQFFEEISIEESEEAGDFFIGKFGDIMKQIKVARRKKRQLVTQFEEEIEAREKAVRGKSENLDKMLSDMKAGGEGVLRGKV
jgi:hypothetical protein